MDEKAIAALLDEAQSVLEGNWTDGFTKPARSLYPHQWSWDSAFNAIGYAHFDQEKAGQELSRLFSGQWKNGMVPHIVFYETQGEDTYFPGPAFWQTAGLEQVPDHPLTSGICQPPIHATAVRYILEIAEDREQSQAFAEKMFPKLKAWHNFLYRERDPDDEGLVYIRHPWSSGQDNSPNWDKPLNRINLDKVSIPNYQRKDKDHVNSAERPTDESYDRYVYLMDFFRERNYDEEAILQDGCPFLIQDVLFNSLLARAGRDLARIAEWVGEDPAPFHRQYYQTVRAINTKLWDDAHGIYVDYDYGAGKRIEIHMLSGFIPLFAGIPSPQRAARMFDYLNTRSFCRLSSNHLAVPSYDRREPQFSSQKYWRGPIWINMNWMLYKGLKQYGYLEYSRRIKNTIIKLTEKSGFHEYYNPENGKGYGAKDFSWSAALLIDILSADVEFMGNDLGSLND